MINQQTLELYIYVDGENDVPFFSNLYKEYILANGERYVTADNKVFNVKVLNEEIVIHAFTYNAKRMGGAPTISATIKYSECLDELFSEKVYAKFNGEKYFLLATPTSSYSNEEIMYKHEATFVSERIALENTYFYDVVAEDYSGDKPVSNDSTFAFSGDIHELAKRLQYSLNYSHLDYTVIVDEGISSDDKLISADNKFFSEVLQEVYNTFDIPYYFKGREIHIGFTDNAISEVFRYGDSDALMSITKSNANNRTINRATGIGSEDNLPYYYPNISPEGDIQVQLADTNTGLTNPDDIRIVDYEKFSKNLIMNQEVQLHPSRETVSSPLEFYGYFQDRVRYFTITDRNRLKNQVATTAKGLDTLYQVSFNIQNIDPSASTRGNWGETDDDLEWLPAGISWKTIGDIRPSGIIPFISVLDCKENENFLSQVTIGKPRLYWIVNAYKADAWSWGFEEIKKEELKYNDEYGYYEFPNFNESLDFNKETPFEEGMGYVSIKLEWDVLAPKAVYDLEIGFEFYDFSSPVWKVNENVVKLEDLGLVIENTPNIGDKFQKILGENGFIPHQKHLMPPIYRETFGEERFYNAVNNTHLIPDENENYTEDYYEFVNEYNGHNPKEQIVQFDEIKPTIKGFSNSEGLRIDMFSEFAYDENDNNERYEDDGKVIYKHPIFFGKLRKLSFNLFDHALDDGEMEIHMTDGNCGACVFKIAVDEDTHKDNLVQVDEYGNLVRDDEGDVRCGREGKPEETAQPRQQDTINHEVWIALYKDKDTFGELFPFENIKPKGCTRNEDGTYNNDGDTFVITHIRLPQAYIERAEERLYQQIVFFMFDNNAENFKYSIKFSRIYFAEHPEILELLDENARLIVEYDGIQKNLYISSLTYKTTENELLPEITVELADELTVSQNSVQKATNQVKSELYQAMYGIDVIAQGTGVFLRKDQPDTANAPITFNAKPILATGATLDKQMNSKDYFEGVKGLSIHKDENNNWHVEADYLYARKKFSAKEVEIQKVYHIGGAQIKSSASMVCSRVVELENSYRCWFEANDEDGNIINNQFMVGDQAYVQTFNLVDDGNGNSTNHFYWRLVEAVDANSITLSKTNCAEGSTPPMVGDNIVQLGYQGNDRPERQVAVIDAGAGEGAPYYCQYIGINSFALPEPETQLKPNDNILTGKVDIRQGSLLSGAIAVKDETDRVVAGINGSDNDSNYAMEDDTLMIFAGANGEENAKDANFRVTKSGKVVAKSADIEGIVNATSGTFDNGEFTNAKVSGEVNANKGTFSNGIFDNVTINGSISSPFQSYDGTTLIISVDNQFTLWNRNIKGDKVVNGVKYLAWVNMIGRTFYSRVADIPIGFNNFYELISADGVSFAVVPLNKYSVYNISNALIGLNGIGKHDNLAITVDSDKREFSAEELDWSPVNSGRIVRLVNAPYNGQQTVGYAKLYAPQGKYFFEDGEHYSSIIFSNQVLELIGYGDDSEFYGWIVLNRKDISTQNSYGTSPKVLYQGVIRNSTIEKLWTPELNYSNQVTSLSASYDNTNSVIALPKLSYRGLSDTSNWEVIVSNAVVKAKSYDSEKETIRFQIGLLSGANHVVFQVISTADWATLVSTTNEE